MTPDVPPPPPTPDSSPAEPRAIRAARPFTVRHAGAADVGHAAVLFDAYRQFYGAASDVAAARRFLATRLARGESVVLLALRIPPHDTAPGPAASGAVDAIGFAQLYPSFSSVSLGTIVTLNDLFVMPAWRRSGVARRLVQEAAACAARAGAIRLELATQSTNAPARRLYDLMGFVPDLEFTHLSLMLSPA